MGYDNGEGNGGNGNGNGGTDSDGPPPPPSEWVNVEHKDAGVNDSNGEDD